MSDTPRTNKFAGVWASTGYGGKTIFEHAQDMEAESDQLAKQCVKLVEEIGELRTRNKHLDAILKGWKEDEGADAARLEWLISQTCDEYYCGGNILTREGIDRAMKLTEDQS